MSTQILKPSLQRNDRLAGWLIISFSVIVFGVVAALGRLPRLEVDLGFDPHIFATVNAVINTLVSALLLWAYWLVRRKQYAAHRNVMYGAMVLSILFLVSYIAHHLLSGDTRFGDVDHDGIVSATELAAVQGTRMIYFILLGTHIFLASVILPFILYTAYRGMSGDYQRHRKLARYTLPLWLYVSVTGPVVYLMISPYY